MGVHCSVAVVGGMEGWGRGFDDQLLRVLGISRMGESAMASWGLG